MSVRFEKEPSGDYALIVGFDGTIADDPYSGTGLMQAVDVEVPGEVACGYPLDAISISGATLGVSIARSTRYFFAYGSTEGAGTEYGYALLDADGHVFQSTTSVTASWTYLSSGATLSGASSLDGMIYFLGYLFKTRGGNVDYWNGTTWTNAWKADLSPGFKHFMFIAPNSVLYITNGNVIASLVPLAPITSFNPGTPGTFTWNASTIRLPIGDVAQSLASVNSGGAAGFQLLIGGSQNAVYPWSGLTPTVSQQIYVADSYIAKMVSVNQNAFIFPGRYSGRGNIYITNGSQADLYFKIPDHIFGVQDPFFEWGDVIFHRNNLIFGFNAFTVSGGSPTNLTNQSIWALNLKDKKFRSVSFAGAGNIIPGVLIPIITPDTLTLNTNYVGGLAYYAGVSGAANVLYISNVNAGINGTGTTVHTDLIPVGTFLQKKTFTQVEFKLRTPLAAGETLTVTPVVDGITGSALSFQPTITTGSISGVSPVNFQGAQWVKFIVTMVGTSNSSGVRLRELRIR